ncbi:MAG: 4Fe-4S dicluster domain-containing protein [Candidatus Hodarchaeales archaeon]
MVAIITPLVNIVWGPLKSLYNIVLHPMKIPFVLFFTRPIALMSFHPNVKDGEVAPEYLSEHNFRFRGLIGIDMARCTGCRRCERVCPNKIIRMVPRADEVTTARFSELVPAPTNRKKVYPEIYFGRCLFCGYCGEELVGGCPFDALHLTNMYDISDVFDDNLIFTPEKLQQVVYKVGRGTQSWWTKEPDKPKPKKPKPVKTTPPVEKKEEPAGGSTPTPTA